MAGLEPATRPASVHEPKYFDDKMINRWSYLPRGRGALGGRLKTGHGEKISCQSSDL
jgi:hypothetical protein